MSNIIILDKNVKNKKESFLFKDSVLTVICSFSFSKFKLKFNIKHHVEDPDSHLLKIYGILDGGKILLSQFDIESEKDEEFTIENTKYNKLELAISNNTKIGKFIKSDYGLDEINEGYYIFS